MAMVIMSPLSELTDTDGSEMRSISQRPPPLPRPPALLLPESVRQQRAAGRVTRGQVQQSERSRGSCDAPLGPFWGTSAPPPQRPETPPTCAWPFQRKNTLGFFS